MPYKIVFHVFEDMGNEEVETITISHDEGLNKLGKELTRITHGSKDVRLALKETRKTADILEIDLRIFWPKRKQH